MSRSKRQSGDWSRRLKGNQITIDNKLRPPRLTRSHNSFLEEVHIDSPEYNLLVRLYVPSDVLIHNNRVSKKQLLLYLPQIVRPSYKRLNFELHVFLSTIVTSYVALWYLRVLNTDKFDFVARVYGLLCDVFVDISRRIEDVLSLRLFDLASDLALVVESHVQDVKMDGGSRSFEANFKVRPILSEGLERDYLRASHVLFSSEENLNLDYLRVLARNIVACSLARSGAKLDSEIAESLLTSIVGDLVLQALVVKILAPRFIRGTIVSTIADKLEGREIAKKSKPLPLWERLSARWAWLHANLGFFRLALRTSTESPSTYSIFHNPLVSLANTATLFDQRRPLLAGAFRFLASAMSYAPRAANLDSLGRKIVVKTVLTSRVVQDASLAEIAHLLRDSLFGDKPGPTAEPPSNLELALRIYDALDELLIEKTGFGLLWLAYKHETKADLVQDIEGFLSLFDGPDPEFSGLNALMIMRCVDTIAIYLYPELAEDV